MNTNYWDQPALEIQEAPVEVKERHWYEIWWIALRYPSPEWYRQLLETTTQISLGRVLKWMLAASIISAVSTEYAHSKITERFISQSMPLQTMVASIVISVVIQVIGWLVIHALIHWIAIRLNGKGTYTQLAFLIAAHDAPISIFTVLFSLPTAILVFLGLCTPLFLVFSAAVMVLDIFAIMAVYQFSWRRAIIAYIPRLLQFAYVLALTHGLITF